jgi:outer membrane murein-binding lipoprotein Lpp
VTISIEDIKGWLEEAKKNKLGKLSAQRDQINKDVIQWTSEIQALQQKITAANENLVSVDSQYVAEEVKLNANIKNYVATKQAVLSNLQRISDTVKIHLQ